MGFRVLIVVLTYSDRPGSYRVLKFVPNFSAHPLKWRVPARVKFIDNIVKKEKREANRLERG